MSKLFEIPTRTIENWESGTRKPPVYVEKLIIEKLMQIKNGEARKGLLAYFFHDEE